MGFGGALLALSAVQAISQIGQGYAQREKGLAIQAEHDLNATIIEGKAGLIDVAKGIEKEQYDKYAGRIMGESYASVAAMGLRPSGSVMNVIVATQKAIRIDQAIGQFNFEQEKRFTLAEARGERRRGEWAAEEGKQAVRSGYVNAFSTMLSAAAQYGMYKGMSKKTTVTQQGTVKDTTFDKVFKVQPIRGSMRPRVHKWLF